MAFEVADLTIEYGHSRVHALTSSPYLDGSFRVRYHRPMPAPTRSPKADFRNRPVIEPVGGPSHELVTLAHVASFIGHMHPRRQARPVWEHAAELLLTAATTGKRADIAAGTAHVERVLRAENWL
jgi:hypothetical protein